MQNHVHGTQQIGERLQFQAEKRLVL